LSAAGVRTRTSNCPPVSISRFGGRCCANAFQPEFEERDGALFDDQLVVGGVPGDIGDDIKRGSVFAVDVGRQN